ncbi:MAG TPA: hypothetical protein VN934_11540 [Candidatus Tumulicola sp.]|nr:hypothetical protein [Candidatus Tumulicola sp.]
MHWLDAGDFGIRFACGVVAAAWLWALAADLGSWTIAKLLPDVEGGHARFVGAALGYALIGSAVALLGLAHLASSLAAIALLVILTLARAPAHIRMMAQTPGLFAALGASWRDGTALDKCAYAIVGAAITTAAVAAALPAVWWDPIAYHLPLVARALERGTFGFDQQMVQSAFPQLSEAAALPAYAIAGSAGAAFATLGAGITLVMLCGVIAQRLAPGSGPIAAALLAASPLWLWLAPTFYIDVPFALFLVAALAVPLFAGDKSDDKNDDRNVAFRAKSGFSLGVLCGALAGAAAASKYPGLPAGAIAAGFAVALAPAQWRARLGGFGIGFALMAAGWYARTWALAGDPLYPLFVANFGASPELQAFGQRYLEMTRHWCGGGTSLRDAFLLPWRLVADPRSFCGDPGYALRLGGILAIAAVALLRRTRSLALVGMALTAVWFVTTQQWRFLLPALSLMSIIAAAGAVDAAPRLRNVACAVLLGLCVFGVASNWFAALENEASNSLAPAFAYLAHAETGAQYLRARLETYGAAEWLGAKAPGAKIVALDDVRDYYFGSNTVWANPFYQARWDVDWQAPAKRRYQDFMDAGFTYMVVNAHPAYVRRTPTGIDWGVLAADERAGVLRRMFSADSVTVYALEEKR